MLLGQRFPAAYSACTLLKVRALVASAFSPERPARIWGKLSTCHLNLLLCTDYLALIIIFLFSCFSFFELLLSSFTFFVALGIFLFIQGYEPGQI